MRVKKRGPSIPRSIVAQMRERYIFNFRTRPEALAPRLPVPWLEPQVVNGWSAISFCILKLERLTIWPLPALFDHAYLHLRMCCWQGAIASATNEIWQGVSPLLLRRPLETLYRLPDRERLGHALIHALFLSFPEPIHTLPLTTGFPPLAPSAANLWRFIPGLLGMPVEAWRRARGRFRRGRPDPEAGGAVGGVMASGAADYLRPREMALRPLLDDARLEAFLARPSFPLLGRLIALEWAARESR